MTPSAPRLLPLFLLALALPVLSCAVPVEIRLVPYDQTGLTVDKLEKQRPILNPVSTSHGVEMRQVGIDYTGWGRNILVDDAPVFERYYQGKYIDRLPVARPDLKPGAHVIWPGNHAFAVDAGGAVTTSDPELIVDGGVLKLKCYPVTLRAYLANPDESDLPMTMRTTPLPNLTLRDAANADAPGKDGVRELLPIFEEFAPLTLWLPANTEGKGYLVHPVGLTFHLSAGGVAAGAGGGQGIEGLHVDKNLIEIPLHGFPFVGDVGSRAIVTGINQYTWGDHDQGSIRQLLLYPRREPFEFLVTKPGPALALSAAPLPYKSFRVDIPDASVGAQRALVAELATRHFVPGGTATGRIRAIDATPAFTANRAATQTRRAASIARRDLQTAQKTSDDAEKAWQAAKTAEADAQKDAPSSPSATPGTTDPDGETPAAAKQNLAAAREKLAASIKLLAEAKDRVATASALADKTEAAADEAASAVETQSLLNPLANATPFAELQPYGGSDWIALAIKPGADGAVSFTLPSAASTGVYRLRLGVRPADSNGKPLFAEQWVSIAIPQPAGLGLFTPRGRNAFYRGETFWLGLTLLTREPRADGAPVEVDLVDETGTRLPLLREKSAAVEKRQTLIVQLDGAQSLSLAAGRYRVEAKIGTRSAAPLAIELVEPEPRTHFTTLLNGKYNVLGGSHSSFSYGGIIKSGEGAETLVSEITAMGYNTFMGMSYDISRVHRHNLDLEQVVRERPELGPWETYYQPSGRDRVLNAAVRRNLAFYENLFTYNDSMLPRDPHILDACERFSSLEAAALRHSPAFRGVCLYDEVYESSDNGAPRSVVAAFFNAQELRYRAQFPGMTSSDATKALDRFIGRPASQRNYEDLAKFRTWPALRDSDWEQFTTRMSAAVKEAAPGSKNWTQYRAMGSNGGNIAGMGIPEQVFAHLDFAATVMYKDGGYGDRPVFAPMLANIMRFRDDLPVWTQIHNFGASGLFGGHLLRQTLFGLSQKLDGLSFFTIDVTPENPDPLDNRETVRDIADRLLTPYGDFFTSLNRGYRKVAVFYSRESDYLAERKPNRLSLTAEGLWVSCIRAGFPADFLYDRHIREGKGLDYDVIFAPGYYYEDEASPEILTALKRLVATGKTVVVERSSKLPIEGIVRLDSDLDEYDDKLGGAFPRYVDFETSMVWDRTEETTKLLREFLAKKTKPAAIHNLIVGPDWLRCGQGEYMVIPNWAPTGFTGLNKTIYQAPSIAPLRFPIRPAFAYDVLEMHRVDVKTDGDWMTLDADMRSIPGKVFAFLPSAIDKVALKVADRLAAGTDLSFRASVANAGGETIDAAFPLEITLLDAAGKEQLHVFRSAKPAFEMAWRVPVNLASGAWKLRVRELISGAVSEAKIDVTPPVSAAVAGKLDNRPVWIHDADRIHKFITGDASAKDSPGIVIALDAEQPWTRPHAEKLAAALKARGRAVTIAAVSDVVRIPNDWGEIPVLDGGRLWRGDLVDPGIFVDAPLILLGRRYENRLIEALARRDVLPEVISSNFPASGKAVIGWTRRAFSTTHDTVTILANDDSGLAAGIAAFPDIAGPAETRSLARANYQAPATPPAVTTAGKEPASLRDALSAEDRVRSLDVDPATGRIVIGTFGFGHNLFCFSAEGKLLWKQFLPEHNVYFTRWIDGGKRIVAATGQGFFLFLVNGQDGTVAKKLASTERPRFHESYGLPNLEGAENTELQIVVNTQLREIVVRGLTGLMALDFDGKKLWFHDRAEAIAAYPEEAEQSVASSFGSSVYVGNFALSPDGGRLVYSEEIIAGSTPGVKPGTKDYLWRHTPKVLDARTGKVLLQNNEDPGNYTAPKQWSVVWPPDAATPRVRTAGVSAPLRDDGTLGAYTPDAGSSRLALKDGGWLVATPKTAARYSADGQIRWNLVGSTVWLPQLDALNDAQTRFYRSDRDGLIRAIDFATGRTLWNFKQPFFSVLAPNGDELVAGANNGAIVRLDAAGKPVWQTRLREHHELPGGDYPAYLAAARLRDADSSDEFFPAGSDGPDDYKGVLRMGIEQLANGDFETSAGWETAQPPVILSAPAKTGKLSLQLDAGHLVTQRLAGRVIPSATYLLEFWYRADDANGRLTAGTMLEGEKQTFTGSQYSARPGEWTFGRLALKTMADTKTIEVGFEASGGRVHVDAASLRAVRFPSANLLANAELQAVVQTYVKDIRVQYERIPPQLRERLMTRNRTAGFAQGITSTAMIYTQEAAFLQNGKLDDVGNTWTNAPDPMAFSVTLTKPAYISHLVIYLNNATPENVYPMISILADNLEIKAPQSVGLVRMNKRRFIVVHFPQPLHTDALKIIPSYYAAHTDSITEIEVYGPLDGGKPADAAAADPDAVPMLMGTTARVPAKLPTDLTGSWLPFGSGFRINPFPPFASGATVIDGMFSLADPDGAIRSVYAPASEPVVRGQKPDPRANRLQLGPVWTLATVTPTTTPARHRGRLLVGSADYKLHAVADNGTYLWSFATDGRIYSSPAPQGDDVFFGSDDHHLYKVDVDSGILIWEFATGNKVRGAPALADGRVFVPSWDGTLYAVDAESGRLLWKAPVAQLTRSTPAVHDGRVYLGDEAGAMRAFDAVTGKELWNQPLGGYISTAPVVAPDGIAFASEQGGLAFIGLDGATKWKRSLGVRVSGQPIATQTQLLVPTEKGLLVLRRADGEPDTRFAGPELKEKVLSVLKWRDQLFVHTGYARTDLSRGPRTYAEFKNITAIWVPAPAKTTSKEAK